MFWPQPKPNPMQSQTENNIYSLALGKLKQQANPDVIGRIGGFFSGATGGRLGTPAVSQSQMAPYQPGVGGVYSQPTGGIQSPMASLFQMNSGETQRQLKWNPWLSGAFGPQR